MTDVRTAQLHAMVACAALAWAAFEWSLSGGRIAGAVSAAYVAALIAFPALITGTQRLLAPAVLGRRLVPTGLTRLVPLLLLTGGGLGFVWAEDATLVFDRDGFVWLWAAGMGLGILFPIMTGVAAARAGRKAPPMLLGRIPGHARAFIVASHVMGAVAVVATPMAFSGTLALPVGVHASLVGYASLGIVGFGGFLLPRFLHARISTAVGWLAFALLVPGLAFLLVGFGARAEGALHAGAWLTSGGFVAYALGVMSLILRSRRWRASTLCYLGAVVFLILGVTLGAHMVADAAQRKWLHIHAAANIFGFLATFALGAVLDLYGPGLWRGAKAVRVTAWLVTICSLLGVLWFVGAGLWAAPYAWFGLALVAFAWSLTGISLGATWARTVALKPQALPDD